MAQFNGRYRVESTRLPHHDYASVAWYHAVTCTRRRARWFGYVADSGVVLSPLGVIAAGHCAEIPDHVPRAVLDSFVVMPDHIHLVLGLRDFDAVGLAGAGNRFGPLQPGSLPVVIGAYKASVARWARQNGHAQFAWQPRDFERVIRDERELERTRTYIRANPMLSGAK